MRDAFLFLNGLGNLSTTKFCHYGKVLKNRLIFILCMSFSLPTVRKKSSLSDKNGARDTHFCIKYVYRMTYREWVDSRLTQQC